MKSFNKVLILSFLLIELECYPNLHICILSLYLSLITPNSKKYNLKLYPIGTNFTLALLVLLVTNLASEFLGEAVLHHHFDGADYSDTACY